MKKNRGDRDRTVGERPRCELCGRETIRFVQGGFYCWECVEPSDQEIRDIKADTRYHERRELGG